jgi:hypothetical protein|tara:strand:+ start:792 stop:1040 length:249 start_codon:yes stop_codon:yes gene_type:complete
MIDLNNVDKQAVTALTRLREPGNDALFRLLEAELETSKQKLVHAIDMVQVHRLQGRAEAFEDLLNAVIDAPKVEKRAYAQNT